MRKLLVIALVLAFCLPAAAQAPTAQTGQPNVCQIIVIRPKPGSEVQYVAGHKRHIAWHKSQNDTWTWFTSDIISGHDTGAQLVGTCGHRWADFGPEREKFMQADMADVDKNILPYLAGAQVSFWTFRSDMSRDTTPEAQPAPYLSVTHFFVRPESVTTFADSIKKVNEGIQKTSYGSIPGRFYQLANGGEGPHFVLVVPRKSLADMQGPEKTLDHMMSEAFGDEGKTTLETLRKSYRHTTTELLHFRPDLSYSPGTMAETVRPKGTAKPSPPKTGGEKQGSTPQPK